MTVDPEMLLAVAPLAAVVVALVSAGISILGLRIAAQAREASGRSAQAAEDAVELARQQLRDEHQPILKVGYLPKLHKSGLDSAGFDITSNRDVEDLTVTLLEPDPQEPFVLESIEFLDTGSSGNIGDAVHVGSRPAGHPVRFIGHRRGEFLGGRVNLRCECAVDNERYQIRCSFDWLRPATVHSPVERRIPR